MKLFKILTTVILASIASATSAQSTAPLTFGDSNTDEDNWNYLMHFKLWGTEGISFGYKPEFGDTLGWVGTAAGDLESLGNGGSIGGPIIIGGSISGSSTKITTGPIRSDGTITAQIENDIVKCSSTDLSNECSTDKVPEIRPNLKVPTLPKNIPWSSGITVSGQHVLDISSICPETDICDIFYESISIGNDGILIVSMPDGGRPTRIFTKSLNMATHPQIVVRYTNKGNLKQSEYEGNLLIYVNNDINFANIDNNTIMGTFVSTGTIKLTSKIAFAGQMIANNLIIGNYIDGNYNRFVPFKGPDISLSLLGNRAIIFKEDITWQTVYLGLNNAAKVDVTFDYCFEFYSATGVQNTYAGYQDIGEADASHKIPICNKGESAKATIKAGDTKAEGILIKPLMDGYVEKNESLWLQINNLEGAKLASNYEDGKGYKIYIVSNDKLPTVSSELVIDVNEDASHTFTAAEFKFQHETQSFAAVIITSIPASGTLALNGTAVKSGDEIAVSNFAKFTYTPAENEYASPYTTFKYKVVGDGTGDNTSVEYTARVNVIPVNDKPTVSDVIFSVNELNHTISGGPITVTDVSNERSNDSYSYTLVNVTGSDYTAFSYAFEIVKLTDGNATIKVKTGAVLDYSQKKEYVVYATVSDNAATETSVKAGPLTSEQFKITVKIKNENDDPIIKDQEFSIAEKQADGSDWPSGTSVGKVSATDPDCDPLSFTVDASENVPFKFLNSTNELVVTDGSKLDYETKPSWTFKVVVSDGQGGSATSNVTVNLTDVNEKPKPENLKSEYSVAENSATGTVVGEFVVFDYDKVSSTSYESLTYSLTGALTGAIGGTTAKNMSEIFEIKEKSNVGGGRTVQILVKNQTLLDYEALFNGTNATYPVTITIADSKNSIAVTTKIAVTDVNENHTATGGTFYLLEHSAGGTSVCSEKHNEDGECEGNYGQVKFVDPDLRNSLKFRMSAANTGDDASAFTVDYQGFIKTSGNEEFEYDGSGAKREYTFLVTVYDNDFSVDVKVTVKIENIEEPAIQLTTEGAGSIKENADNYSVADKFSKEKLIEENPSMAAEFDNIGEIQEYIIGDVKGPHGSDIFFVDAEKGNIQVNDNTYLNFEELYPNNSYEVQIVVKGEKNDLIINRTVVVVDVNEKPVSRDTTFSVKETIEGGATVGKLWATDPDSCSNILAKACRNGSHPYGFNKLTYTIVDDTDLPFEINQSSGEITLKQGEKLSYTKKKEYEFEVKVMDRSLDPDNQPLSTTAKVTVNVTDMNRPSEFKVLSDLYETEENVKVGSYLTGDTIVVYDEDAADASMLKITMTDKDATTSRDAAKLFEVVQVGSTDADHLSKFVIKTKRSIDYEELYKAADKNAIFNVVLTITDVEGNKTSKDTKIRVIDVNEEPNVVTPDPFTIAENTTKATSLGVIKATDPDIYNANFGTLYFSLKGDEAAQFDIDASTGELSTINNAKFDYETKSSYKFKAVVTDKKYTKEVYVVVNVLDMPEVPKFPNNPPALAVDENTKKGTKVGDVVATDDDCKDTHIATCKQPTYSLAATDIAATDYKSFTIDKNGTITVAKDSILNFEVKKEYSVRVIATDGSDPTLSSYIDATIKINDVNDAPTYEYKEYAFEIHESAPKGQFVGSVVAGDEDTWKKLTYTLSDYVTNSKDSEVFRIDPETGKIYLDAPIDYEAKNTYKVFAKVADNGKDKGFENYSATALVTINVIDAPDPPEIVDDGKKSYDVAENTPTWTVIACYKVKDEDEKFLVNANIVVKNASNLKRSSFFGTGLTKKDSIYELCLIKSATALDYETMEHSHEIIISVTNESNLTTEISKTINILDVNEKPVISGNTEFSFYEHTGKNKIIGKLNSNDLDTAAIFTNNIFKIVSGDTSSFTITEDGKIFTKRDFNYEEDRHSFEIKIALSDKDLATYPDLITTENITITLKDMPEVPEITSKEFSVKENSKAGELIGIIEATDPDIDDTLKIFLDDESPYVTVSSNGEIRVREGANIDYEKMQKFTITVIAKDKDGLQSLPEEIVINVIDIDEPSSSSTIAKSSSSSKEITAKSSSSRNDKASSSSYNNAKSSSSSTAKSSSSSKGIATNSSSSRNDKASSSSYNDKKSSSSSKISDDEIPDFYVRMTGAFEFEIVMDESVPSIAKKYAVMDMKGQVLTIGELNDKNAYVKVPTRGAYIVKVGLGYRRINVR